MVDWEELTDEQRRAAGTLDRNVSLTAGAGTGKTTALTARMMQVLRRQVESGDADELLGPENLLTTTFTERAANELREVVREEIADELETASEDEYTRWRALADELDSGYIHTLHGFCSRLLREHALESADIEPGFETLDEEETAALQRRVVARTIEQQDRSEPVRTLARRYTRSQLVDILSELLAQRPESLEWADRWKDADEAAYLEHVWTDLHPISPSFARDSFDLGTEAGAAFATLQDVVISSPAIDESDNMWGMAVEVVERLDAAGIDMLSETRPDDRTLQRCINDICDILTTYKGQLYSDGYYEGSDGNWTGHDAERESLVTALSAVLVRLEPTRLHVGADIGADAESFRYVRALAEALDTVGGRFAAEKRRRNLVDYTDQIAYARRFLVEDATAETRTELREQFAFVMVDEFQDTDPRQWDIIRALTSTEPTEFDARNVFVVGDTKQSIYRFRNADVTMFDSVAEELIATNPSEGGRERSGSDGEQLSENFRTLPNVLSVINELFDETFTSGPSASFEATPQPLSAHRSDPADIEATAEYLCVPTDEALLERLYDTPPIDPGSATSSAELEAEALAARLTRILDGGRQVYETEREAEVDSTPVLNRASEPGTSDGEPESIDIEPKDIAILLRSRTNLKIYERTLSEAGIPYTVASGLGFYEAPEVQALINLLRVLVDPDDERALYAVLRSPLFGLTDETIVQLRIESPDSGLWAALLGTDTQELAAAGALLQRWRRTAGLGAADRAVESWADLLTEVIDAVGYLVSVSAGERPKQAVANVEKLREQLRSWDEDGVESLPQLLDRIEERLEQSQREGEADIPEGAEGIQIMTVHDAKGDEFPMVAIPGLDRTFMDRGSVANGKVEFETLPSGPAVGLKGPDPDDPMRETSTIAREGISRRRKREERAEEKRVLYVACTRARDHLLLSGGHDVDTDADVETDGLHAIEPGEPIVADSWRDWVQDVLLTDDVLDTLEADGSATATLGEGTYQVRLPEPAVDWDPTTESIEPTVAVTRPEISGSEPRFRFSPSSLGKLLAGDGEIVLDEHENRFRFRTEERNSEDGSDGIETGAKGIPADVFGDIVHKLAERQPPESEWRRIVAEYVADSDGDIGDLDMDALRTHARNAIGFVTDLEEQSTVETLHHELFVTATFDRGELGGFIDLLAVTDGTYHIVDYKTSSLDGTTATAKVEEYLPQLETYAIALAQQNPSRSVEATVLFTESGETVTETYDGDELPMLEASLAKDIESRLPEI